MSLKMLPAIQCFKFGLHDLVLFVAVCKLSLCYCRDALTAGVGASRMSGKRSKQMAELVEVEIPGAPPPVPQRAPVARDASVDPYIGRQIM